MNRWGPGPVNSATTIPGTSTLVDSPPIRSVIVMAAANTSESFWRRVNKGGPGGCWLWTGRPESNGYALVRWHGKRVGVHRLAYELTLGPVPPVLELDHLCRVRLCVNPRHLEPVTHRENILRGRTPMARNAARSHCPEGHPYDENNTYRYRGKRYCRECQRIAHRGRMRRKRQEFKV